MNVLLLIGGIVIAGLVSWILTIIFTDEKHKSKSMFINTMPSYSSGYSRGVIVNKKEVKNRVIVDFEPSDISEEMFNKGIKPEIQTVVFDKDKFQVLPKFTLSNNEDLFIGLAARAEDFNTELKKTVIGQALMKVTEEINANNTEIIFARKTADMQRKIIEKSGGSEISEWFLQQNDEEKKILAKSLMEAFGKTAPQSQTHSNYPVPTRAF